MTIAPWSRFAESLLTREFLVQGMLRVSGLPVPEPLAVDPRGEQAGAPSLLMTLVPGRMDITRCDGDSLAALAEVLVLVHRYRPADHGWPREYQSWAFESKRVVPSWSADPGLWREAFARLAEPAPPYRRTFIHRDFYPANVLWRGDRLSGLVDWVETSTGPADLDVAHCVTNVTSWHGLQRGLAFREAYAAAGGVLEPDADAARYWQLMDLVGFLPVDGRESGATRASLEATWSAHGLVGLTVERARSHREDLLRHLLRGARPRCSP